MQLCYLLKKKKKPKKETPQKNTKFVQDLLTVETNKWTSKIN